MYFFILLGSECGAYCGDQQTSLTPTHDHERTCAKLSTWSVPLAISLRTSSKSHQGGDHSGQNIVREPFKRRFAVKHVATVVVCAFRVVKYICAASTITWRKESAKRSAGEVAVFYFLFSTRQEYLTNLIATKSQQQASSLIFKNINRCIRPNFFATIFFVRFLL